MDFLNDKNLKQNIKQVELIDDVNGEIIIHNSF